MILTHVTSQISRILSESRFYFTGNGFYVIYYRITELQNVRRHIRNRNEETTASVNILAHFLTSKYQDTNLINLPRCLIMLVGVYSENSWLGHRVMGLVRCLSITLET